MYIGEASKRSGLTIKAIRFYEKIGLISAPKRAGRYRVYQESDIELLILIKEARALGIPLARLKQVIAIEGGEVNWAGIKVFLADMRVQLLAQIEDLNKKVEALDTCYRQINP